MREFTAPASHEFQTAAERCETLRSAEKHLTRKLLLACADEKRTQSSFKCYCLIIEAYLQTSACRTI